MSTTLALGTAQFGMAYGISNQVGRVGSEQVAAILALARGNGIDVLDTAIAYGDSEATLGALEIADWRVITKLPACPAAESGIGTWMRNEVMGSLARLGVPRLYGILLHRPMELLDSAGGSLYKALLDLKTSGLVERIGISIYAPDELDALGGRFALDMVQAPMNVLDRRMLASGWLHRLQDEGAEVHIRSAFLQGLLLMPRAERPTRFDRWQPLWNEWHRWLDANQLTALQAAIRFAMSDPAVAQVVVGVDSASQLQEIISAADGELPGLPAALATTDIDLLNPARWAAL